MAIIFYVSPAHLADVLREGHAGSTDTRRVCRNSGQGLNLCGEHSSVLKCERASLSHRDVIETLVHPTTAQAVSLHLCFCAVAVSVQLR